MEEIKLIQTLSDTEYELISKLEENCINNDKTALKIELDYKLAVSKEGDTVDKMHLDYLYFLDGKLIGYLGICSFGGMSTEINGMVDPIYRRKGIFGKLFHLATNELYHHYKEKSLLLSDRKSESGQKFIHQLKPGGLKISHSEYEMYLNREKFKQVQAPTKAILRKATNQDAEEIAKQNAIYFDQPLDETKLIMPETEEKRGMTVYMAYLEDQCIGKIHLELSRGTGGIYGVGIRPEQRGKGYGRQILLEGIGILLDQQAKEIKLQVEAENDNALGLYCSCGFESTSTMDYYIYNNGSRDYGKSI